MRRPTSATLAAITLLGSLAAAPPMAAHAAGETPGGAPGSALTAVTVPGHGGTPLKAYVITPTGRGDGPFPLLVMPGSWSLSRDEYVGAARKLATERGFEIVSYTSRGFYDSGGEIEIAGTEDINDASRVIDWALANTPADAKRIGMAGISYGAGISVLVAAHDPRVRAVSAMSAWSDLTASLYPNRTLNEQSAFVLMISGNGTGRPGSDMRRLQQAYFDNDFEPVLGMAPPRSPLTYLDRLNANRPAVLLANGWLDGVFPAGQLPGLYSRLTGPKRLMLQPGDHGTAEGSGAVGFPNDAWAATARWFDRYLNGVDNGIDREAPIQLKPGNGGGWQGFATWHAVGPRRTTYRLGVKERLATRPVTGRLTRIRAGRNTEAESGVIEASGLAQQAGIHWTARISRIDRRDGAVWSGGKIRRTTMISGAPVLRAVVTPSAKRTSVFAYLYDVAPDGVGSLVTHAPYTLRDVRPGRSYAIEMAMQPARWKLAPGHHLSLVIDTMDGRYRSTSTKGTTVTFGSTAEHPATLALPTN